MFSSKTNNKIKNQSENSNYKKGNDPDIKLKSPEIIAVNTELSLQDIIDNEREEILERNETLNRQGKKFKPIRTGSFLLMRLSMIIFPLNIILLFFWSFGKNTNSNRKAFARSSLIYYVILTLLIIIVLALLVLSGVPLIPDYLFNKIVS